MGGQIIIARPFAPKNQEARFPCSYLLKKATSAQNPKGQGFRS